MQWEGMFPPRPRRRKALVESLAERFTEGGWFRENPPGSGDFDALEQAVAHATALKASLGAKLPDDKPDIDKFIRTLTAYAAERPKEKAAQPADAPSTGGGTATTFTASEILDPKGAIKAIRDAASFLRKADLSDPRPYGVVRILEWCKLTLPAVADPPSKQLTVLEGPSAEQLDAVRSAHKETKWEELIKSAEAAFRVFPLWMDLQWYVYTAMAYLGPAYEAAQNLILTMTAAKVNSLGTAVYDLKFANGVPFCTGDTKLWIQKAGTSSSADHAGGSSNGRLTEAYSRACGLAGTGKLKEAIEELLSGSISSSQRRDRLLWRLRIAQLCVDTQHLSLAQPILQSCFDEIQRHQIDEWEPSLAAEVAQSLYRCRKALAALHKPADGESKKLPAALEAGLDESFGWLCRLDPLAALASEPVNK